MAKVAYSKLNLKKNTDIETFIWNALSIEVKQYLPINDKLILISNIINRSADANNFVNPIKIEMFTLLEMVEAYTNINLTEKQKEDPCKLYDALVSSGFAQVFLQTVPDDEYKVIFDGAMKNAKAIYKYRNSALGIMESISQDYSSLDLDATQIQQKLGDPNNMALLKDVLTKLG